jgi:hypothetical protein
MELTIEDCFAGFGFVPEKESQQECISLRMRKGLVFKIWGRDPTVRLYERLGFVRKVWNGPRARVEGKESLRIVKELYGTRFSRSSSTYTYYRCMDDLPMDALGGEHNQEIDGCVVEPDTMLVYQITVHLCLAELTVCSPVDIDEYSIYPDENRIESDIDSD